MRHSLLVIAFVAACGSPPSAKGPSVSPNQYRIAGPWKTEPVGGLAACVASSAITAPIETVVVTEDAIVVAGDRVIIASRGPGRISGTTARDGGQLAVQVTDTQDVRELRLTFRKSDCGRVFVGALTTDSPQS